MIIRRKREKDKVAEEKRSRRGKNMWTKVSKYIKIKQIGKATGITQLSIKP